MAKKKVAKKKTSKQTTKKVTKKSSAKKSSTKKKASAPGKNLIGSSVRSLSLEATGDQKVNLANLKGKYVVLYFYPKDSTPGCTIEGQDFTRLHSQFKAANAEVFGVSRDSMKSHENFKNKQKYSIDLISDPEEQLCNQFGVIKEKNLYGRKFMGVDRSTFVIDPSGKVIKEWRGVKVPGHADEVLGFLRSL